MKKNLYYLFLLFSLLGTACNKDKDNAIPEDGELYRHIGYNRQYTTLTVTPIYATEQSSPAFQDLFWAVRENLQVNYGGRQVESFEIVFVSDTSVTLRVLYRSDTGIATATYTYTFTWDAGGLLTLSDLAATNTNGTNLQPYIEDLLTGYLGTYQFRAGWIEDKLPGSKGSLAAFYRADDPSDFFYGTIK